MADAEGKAAPTNGIALYCPKCDYNLCGNPQATYCPECGWDIDVSLARSYTFFAEKGYKLRLILMTVLICISGFLFLTCMPPMFGAFVLIFPSFMLLFTDFGPTARNSDKSLSRVLVLTSIINLVISLDLVLPIRLFSSDWTYILLATCLGLAAWHSLYVLLLARLAQRCKHIHLSRLPILTYVSSGILFLSSIAFVSPIKHIFRDPVHRDDVIGFTTFDNVMMLTIYLSLTAMVILSIITSIRVTMLMPGKRKD